MEHPTLCDSYLTKMTRSYTDVNTIKRTLEPDVSSENGSKPGDIMPCEVSTQASNGYPSIIIGGSDLVSPIERADYREKYLWPRGIQMDVSTPPVENANEHFGTNPLSNYKELELSGIWLNADPEFVHRVTSEYLFMTYYSMSDKQYQAFAIKNLLPQQSHPKELILFGDQDQFFRRSELITDLQSKPCSDSGLDRRFWEPPPPLNPSEPSGNFDFTLSSDFSYWLTLEGLNSDYIHLQNYTTVVAQRMIYPYFSIAIASNHGDLKYAENQIMTIGAFALYNRYLLHSYLVDDGCQIRHYALTMAKSAYSFWCISPVIDDKSDWKGCAMKRVCALDLNIKEGVRQFVRWMNEIHRWGLTDYRDSCFRDIDILLS